MGFSGLKLANLHSSVDTGCNNIYGVGMSVAKALAGLLDARDQIKKTEDVVNFDAVVHRAAKEKLVEASEEFDNALYRALRTAARNVKNRG